MSEKNNVIIVDITDRESTELNSSSELISIRGAGQVATRNPSQKSRLWNLTNNLQEIINTNIPNKVLDIESLVPGEEHIQDYEIKKLSEPCIKVGEIFDTNRDIEKVVNRTFVFKHANQCSLKIFITNTIDNPIEKVQLKREMPEVFRDIDIKPLEFSKAELIKENGERFISWEVSNLEAKKTVELYIECTATINEAEALSLGGLEGTYLIDNYQLTQISPLIRSVTESMSAISKDEGMDPGTWDCDIEFSNESEFDIKFEMVSVDQKIPSGTENIFTQSPNLDMHPQDSWEHEFKVESDDIPKFNSTFDFIVLFEVSTRVFGELSKEPEVYSVIASEVSKKIDPPEIAAYANTNIRIENTISNTGSASIDVVEVSDWIPVDFIPQAKDQIILVIKNQKDSLELQDRTEFVNKILITPEDKNPENQHEIFVSLHNLKELLIPNSELVMSYSVLAKNPRPERKYPSPIIITTNTPIRGEGFKKTTTKEPAFRIKYVKRKLRTMKSIRPGLKKGEFEVVIKIQNKGDVELENIIVQERIPKGFSFSEFTPPKDVKYQINEDGKEVELKLMINLLKGKDSINIDYRCMGSGDYPRLEPEITVLGRTDLKSLDKFISEEKMEEIPEYSPDTKFSKQFLGKINETFTEIYKSINSSPSISNFLSMIDSVKDTYPQGSIRQEFDAIIQKLRDQDNYDKMLVGELQSEIRVKLEYFQKRFF